MRGDIFKNKWSWSVLLVVLLAGCSRLSESSPFPLQDARQTSSIALTASPTGEDPYTQVRLEMVRSTIEERGVSNPAVLQAMRTVPRHKFVLPDYLDRAYADQPLPIGHGQTISQPYIVAWMTELLELDKGDKVLEIGTGSGYQAAVLAELGLGEVFSIEIVPELAKGASDLLKELGYTQVNVIQGDGYFGWPDQAPFDAIIVTAAPDHLPGPLAEQLANGGRLVIPIGPPGGFQTLWKFVNENGDLKAYNMGGVMFVPFTGEGISSGGP